MYVRKKPTKPNHYKPSSFRNMFVSLLRKLIYISHPSGGNEREIAVRLRNNLRKFAELATHVEKNRRTFCVAEIVACKVQTCSVPLKLTLQSCFYEPGERTMSVLVVFLQVVAGAVASFLVGMIWFSPVTFGRIWWRYQFPGKRFGEVEKCR